MTITEKLDELRRKRKMTEKELSEKSGVSAVTLSNWKKGNRRPRLYALGKVTKVLEIDLSILRLYF